jgi:peptidoglycan glycosyltransferase
MSAQIRRVGLGLLIGFLAIFVQLNYVQIFAAEDIAGNRANVRHLIAEYSIERGRILTVDGVEVAVSKPTKHRFKYLRTYPEGDLYGHITGYYSLVFGTDRIERSFHDELLGETGVLSMQDIEDRLFDEEEQGDDVRLTIDSRLQEAARSALGNERGAIVALDPRTGEIRAMWSNPSFDPNPLASQDPKEVRAAWESLNPTSPRSPLVNLATSQGYPPGSTFKVVTGAAALESGRYQPSSTFPDPAELKLPLTTETLTNFSKGTCAGGGSIDLFTAMRVSCDTTFAMLGLRIPNEVRGMSEALGLNDRIPLEIATEPSGFPEIPDDEEPLRAFAGIGQASVRTTALQMALVAATVANDGVVPEPRLVREVIDPGGGIVKRFDPEEVGQAMSPGVASQLTDMMVAVVEAGTGTASQIEGVEVAGKTGTSQTGIEGENPHTWFITFAPARNPKLAVAVIVEHGGAFGSEATGGAVAAPRAKLILEADRGIREW